MHRPATHGVHAQPLLVDVLPLIEILDRPADVRGPSERARAFLTRRQMRGDGPRSSVPLSTGMTTARPDRTMNSKG